MVDFAEIHGMAQNDDVNERKEAVDQIYTNFQNLSKKDKKQAWKDLLALMKDEDSWVQICAAEVLGLAFQYMTDKDQAWKDLLVLTKDEDSNVRRLAASSLGPALQHVTDKEQAWKDLLALTKDENSYVGLRAAYVLGFAIQHMTDKEQATKDILAMTKEEDRYMRECAAFALGPAFQYITDKEQATKDLLALTKDEDSNVQTRSAVALGPAFQYMTDKVEATKILLELINDDYSYISIFAVLSLGPAFAHVTDKVHATKTLLELTNEDDGEMRWGAAVALGAGFAHLTDKEQATKTLLKLTKDEDNIVRESANYSLGKISIYRATEAESEDGLKDEMDKAIGYFEKSSQESTFINPAKFCLPFYRSYKAIIFMQENAEEEIEKNLEEAKQAAEGSESKEKLLEAVENLANALQEAQKLRDLDEIQADLNAYRRYCDRTVELLNETEDKAPGAANLMRRGLPIIDERIKAILSEIQEKTEALCKETIDTPLEDLGKEVNKIGQCLSLVRDPIVLEKSVVNMEIALSDICNHLGRNEKGDACRLLEKSKNEHYIEDKINLINMVLTKIPSSIKEETEYELRNGDTFNIQADQVTVTNNKNSKINKHNSGIINRIHAESSLKIIELLGISFTIAGVIWGISYAILTELEHLTAMRDSIVVFILILLLSLFVLAKKK